jgi:hypothetical protein
VRETEIDGSSSTATHFINCDGVEWVNNVAHNCFADGCHLQRGTRNFVVGLSRLYDCGDDFIGLSSHQYDTYGPVRNGIVLPNVIHDHKTGASGSGVACNGAVGVTVMPQRIDKVAASGITIANFTDGGLACPGRIQVAPGSIISNYGQSGSGHGIAVANARDVSIGRVEVHGSGTGNGINITGSWVNVQIDSPVCRNVDRAVNVNATSQAGDYLRLWTSPYLSDGTNASATYVAGHRLTVDNVNADLCQKDMLYVVGDSTHPIDFVKVSNCFGTRLNAGSNATAFGVQVNYADKLVTRGNFASPNDPAYPLFKAPVYSVNVTTQQSDEIVGTGQTTYDPPSLATAASAMTTVAVTGARFNDFCEASFAADLQGVALRAWVSGNDTVSVRFENNTGTTKDLASAALRVVVKRN